jgi:RHS repeat-associated protein
VGMYQNGKLYAIHTDHIGTPRLITDSAKQVVWQAPYSAFLNNEPSGVLSTVSVNGLTKTTWTKPAVEMNISALGRYRDKESGLTHNSKRTLLSTGDRYTQSDPIGMAGGLNGFVYVGGNPLTSADPYGLFDIGDLIPKDAPIWAMGRAYGGVAAYIIGRVTGDQELSNAAMEGLQCTRAENMGLLGILAGKAPKRQPFPKGGPARDPKTANYLPLPEAVGPHTTLGMREGRNGDYTQGATFDSAGKFTGRTDVTNHGRADHTSPHWHPATGPNSVGNAQPMP